MDSLVKDLVVKSRNHMYVVRLKQVLAHFEIPYLLSFDEGAMVVVIPSSHRDAAKELMAEYQLVDRVEPPDDCFEHFDVLTNEELTTILEQHDTWNVCEQQAALQILEMRLLESGRVMDLARSDIRDRAIVTEQLAGKGQSQR